MKDERDARACLAEAKASGLSRMEWANEWGVNARSLNTWHINLSRRSRARKKVEAPRLVEVVPATARRQTQSRYVVQVGEISIELGDDFEEATLRRLIGVLRSC